MCIIVVLSMLRHAIGMNETPPSAAVSRDPATSPIWSHPVAGPPEPGKGVAAIDTGALWIRWRQERDAGAREALIGHYLNHARIVTANLYARRTHNDVEFDDYLQLARVGLIEAVDRFDPAYGAQFKTFASKRLEGAILNGLIRLTEKNQQINAQGRLRKERLVAVMEAAEDASATGGDAKSAAPSHGTDRLFRYLAEVGIGMALDVLLEDTGMVDAEAFGSGGHAVTPEVSYFRKTEIRQLRGVMNDLVLRLSDQQRLVIRYHYLQEIPLEEIAGIMGVSRGRISQLHRKGLLQLREFMAGRERIWISTVC